MELFFMTIIEAITKVDKVKPNGYTEIEKIQWLSQLDGIIKTEIMDYRIGSEKIDFKGYTDDTPLNTELLIPFPYEDIYIKWLEAQIEYYNGETVRYNNSMIMYNNAVNDFRKWYNKNHLSKGINNFKYF